MRRHHARQVRSAARTGDDHLKAPRFGGACKLRHQRRGPVCRHHFALMRHTELREQFIGMAQSLPIGLAAHDHRNQWLRFVTDGETLLALAKREAGLAVEVAQAFKTSRNRSPHPWCAAAG